MKDHAARQHARGARGFLDRKVEASLKASSSPATVTTATGFLDRKVEASLKGVDVSAPGYHILRFLDRKVEASLKACRTYDRGRYSDLDSSTERSRPH